MANSKASPLLTRSLHLLNLEGHRQADAKIHLYAPIRLKRDWAVRYEIIGLDEIGSPFHHQAVQVDSFGAMVQAIEMIAVKLLNTDVYKDKRLYWFVPGDKCGLDLPVIQSLWRS